MRVCGQVRVERDEIVHACARTHANNYPHTFYITGPLGTRRARAPLRRPLCTQGDPICQEADAAGISDRFLSRGLGAPRPVLLGA